MRKSFGSSKGQMAVVYAATIAGLCAALALGTDVTVMFINWQQVRKTADASAIAGATYLTGLTFPDSAVDSTCTGEADDAQKAACTYAVKNGLSASQVTMSEPTSTTLKVTAYETDLPYYFGKVFGLSNYNVGATAVAQGPGNIQTDTLGMFPVGFQCTKPCNLSSIPGGPIKFGLKFVDGLANGNWQWLSLGGTGSSVLGTNVDTGATGSYTIGQVINSAPGNKGNSSNVNTGLADRFARCKSVESQANFSEPCTTAAANPTDIPIGDPCLVVMPAVDFNGCGGNCNLAIEGFALVYLDSDSTSTTLDGCFVSSVVPNTIAGATAPALGGLVADVLIQ